MSTRYQEAANVLRGLLNKKGGLKTLALGQDIENKVSEPSEGKGERRKLDKSLISHRS